MNYEMRFSREVHITGNDLSPVISICAVFFIIPVLFAVAGRIFTKTAVVRKLNTDDYIIFSALVFSLGQTVTVIIAAQNGLGQHWAQLSEVKRLKVQKSLYAGKILFVIAQVLTKLSIISFIQYLSPGAIKIGYYLGGIFVLWGAGFTIASIFQCSVPDVWRQDNNKCFDITAFWTAFDVFNILTELALFLWPAFIISQVRTTLRRRITIIICFGCRLLVIGVIIAQTIYLHRADSNDISFSWRLSICTQLVQCSSIVTACVPYLRPFLDSLESGLLRSDDLRRRGETGTYGYSGSKSTLGKKPTPSSKNRQVPAVKSIPLRPVGEALHLTTVQADQRHIWDAESVSSRAKINLSQSWSVGVLER